MHHKIKKSIPKSPIKQLEQLNKIRKIISDKICFIDSFYGSSLSIKIYMARLVRIDKKRSELFELIKKLEGVYNEAI